MGVSRDLPRRLGIVALLAALVLVFASGPGSRREPFGTIARHSAFLAERYSAPDGDDYAGTMRIAGALGAAGHEADAGKLKEPWERAQLKRFLGEPHAREATVEAAIGAEARSVE